MKTQKGKGSGEDLGVGRVKAGFLALFCFHRCYFTVSVIQVDRQNNQNRKSIDEERYKIKKKKNMRKDKEKGKVRKGCSFMRLKATLGDSFVSSYGFF